MINEDKHIKKESFWFHGSGHTNYNDLQQGSNELHKPTIDMPLFLCSDPGYSAQYLGNENATFFIFKMKNDINVFDVCNTNDVHKLKIPEIVKNAIIKQKNIYGAILATNRAFGICISNFFEATVSKFNIFESPVLKLRTKYLSYAFDSSHANAFFRNIKHYKYDVVDATNKMQVNQLNELFEWIKALGKHDLDNAIKSFKNWIEYNEEGFPRIVSNDPSDLDMTYAFCRLIYHQIYDVGFSGFAENIFFVGSPSNKDLCLALFDINGIEWVLNKPLHKNEIRKFFKLFNKYKYEISIKEIVQMFVKDDENAK